MLKLDLDNILGSTILFIIIAAVTLFIFTVIWELPKYRVLNPPLFNKFDIVCLGELEGVIQKVSGNAHDSFGWYYEFITLEGAKVTVAESNLRRCN